MPRNEVFAIIDELTLSLQNAKKVPFTDSVMIHQSQTIDALKRIVTNYDPSLEKADKIISNEEHILADAKVEANNAMTEAQTQAQGMVSEANNYAQQSKAQADTYAHETSRQAEEQASAVLADAQSRAQNMTEDAKAQADELVRQTTVRAGAEAQAREMLENANQHAEGLRSQTQQDLSALLDHVDATFSMHLNDLRMLKQNINGAQSFDDEENE
ncbi:MAG: ATP synthase F0 subunit B [Clostridiales bacterium]|nr:ATP synthase F0 subunit B [Clostridiales bacterium]